jgi:hypothetical protein
MKTRTDDSLGPVVLALCESIDSARSLAVWLCYKYNQDELVELGLPSTAVDTEAFAKDYFITEYLSKYKGLKLSIDPATVASDRWIAAEKRCLSTNRVFSDPELRCIPQRVSAVLHSAQRKIARVLGTPRWSEVLADCKWGPGATFDVKREDSSRPNKMTFPLSVTRSALPYLRATIDCDPGWFRAFTGIYPEGPYSSVKTCYNLVRGSRTIFVPKSAKTHRPIAAEPTGNSFLQQGVRSYLRRRLMRFGVDLSDQSLNQRLAQDAYVSKLATIDLSAASDTISINLLQHLLPLDWFIFLDNLRSHETEFDGKWIHLSKFASMGNAYIFELETLVFWALSKSVVEEYSLGTTVSIYGDDIIVPADCSDVLVEVLSECGFSVNTKKSYFSGNFYESCGRHYFKGTDVTPVFQKEVLRLPSEIIRAHNRLKRLCHRQQCIKTAKAETYIRSLYKFRPFPRIPFGVVEDGGFLVNKEEIPYKLDRGYVCHVLDFVVECEFGGDDFEYAYKLRSPYTTQFSKEGWAGRAHKGRWRSRQRWIPLSALEPSNLTLDPNLLDVNLLHRRFLMDIPSRQG